MSTRNFWLLTLGPATAAALLFACSSEWHKHGGEGGEHGNGQAQKEHATAAREADEKDEEKGEGDEADEEHVEVITAADLPAAVRAALDKLAPDAKMARVERQTVEGNKRFEIDFTAGGVEQSATLTDKGETLELEREVAPGALPAAAAAEIQKDFPNAKIHGVTAVQTFSYEVRVEVGGKQHEVKVLASGDIEN